MRWNTKSARRRYDIWKPWFAWRPVKTVDGEWVWWELIERLRVENGWGYDFWMYR
jgi:hypothetical protein